MKKKDFLLLAFIILICIVLFKGTKIQSVEEYYLTHIDDITPESQTVTVSISCNTILSNLDKLDENLKASDYIPSDGIILPPTLMKIREGDTAFDILDRVTREKKIPLIYQGSDMNAFDSVYIKGINHIYEFSCGELSGWIYLVNGESYDFGCDKYKVSDGDIIEWKYTCDLGRDVYYEIPSYPSPSES